MSTVRTMKKTVTIIDSEPHNTYTRRAYLFRLDSNRVAIMGVEVCEGLEVHPSSCVLRESLSRSIHLSRNWCDRVKPFDIDQSLVVCLAGVLHDESKKV